MTVAPPATPPIVAAIRERQRQIAGVVKYPSFRLMGDEWAVVSADLDSLLNAHDALVEALQALRWTSGSLVDGPNSSRVWEAFEQAHKAASEVLRDLDGASQQEEGRDE